MSQFPQALYQFGGNEQLEDGNYTSKLVHNEEERDAALADGFFTTTAEAKGTHFAKLEATRETEADSSAPADRADLEKQAIDLGLKFDARTSDKKLRERIDEALAADKPAE